MIAFAGFAFVGLIYGVFLKAGDPNVATWEVRPLLYLVAMYLLTSRLLTRAVHYQWLAWMAVLAISVQNFFSLHYYFALSSEGRKGIESLTEHPTSLIYGWVFLLALGAFAFRNCSRWTKFLLVMAAIPSA